MFSLQPLRHTSTLPGHGSLLRISLSAGKKRLFSLQKHPLNVRTFREINGLGTIYPRRPAAEFSQVGGELAAEFDMRPLACVSIIKNSISQLIF